MEANWLCTLIAHWTENTHPDWLISIRVWRGIQCRVTLLQDVRMLQFAFSVLNDFQQHRQIACSWTVHFGSNGELMFNSPTYSPKIA